MNKFDTTNSYWLEPTCSCLKYRCCQSLGYVARDNTSDACIRVYMSAAGGGDFLVKDYWECAAGWGRIFTTGLTINGSYF